MCDMKLKLNCHIKGAECSFLNQFFNQGRIMINGCFGGSSLASYKVDPSEINNFELKTKALSAAPRSRKMPNCNGIETLGLLNHSLIFSRWSRSEHWPELLVSLVAILWFLT